MRKYTESHEWILIENEIATIGITQIAADEIGEIAYVALPEIGKVIHKDDICAVVESSKAAIDIASPVSGEVVAVNKELMDTPERVNEAPEGEGWLYQIKLYNRDELLSYMDVKTYINKMKEISS